MTQRRGSLLLALSAALSLSIPGRADALEIARERSLAVDMVPAPGFTALRSVRDPKTGTVPTLRVSSEMDVAAIRVRLAVEAPDGIPWTVIVRSPDRKDEYQRIDGVGGVSELWTGIVPAPGASIDVELGASPPAEFELSATALAQRVFGARVEAIVGVNDIEPWQEIEDEVRPWGSPVAWIGVMVGGRQLTCTGFLVSDDLILTNHHCISNPREAASAVFVFGYDRPQGGGREYYASRLEAVDETHDYALVRLQQAAGRRFGHLAFAGVPLAPETPLAVIHHPAGEPRSLSIQRVGARRNGCDVTALPVPGIKDQLVDFKHGCDTLPGSSGAPVIDPARRIVVGLHHLGCPGACDQDAKVVNQGVLASKLLAHLREAGRGALAREIDGAPGAIGDVAAAAAPANGPATATSVPSAPAVATAEASPPAPPPPPAPAFEAAVAAEPAAPAALRTKFAPRPESAPAALVAQAYEGRALPPGTFLSRQAEAFEPLTLSAAPLQRFSIQEENDMFGATNPTDNFYTQGLRISARWIPEAPRRLVKVVGAIELWGLELGQNIYTPTSIRETDLAKLRQDRPYAGYLYAGPTWELRWPWSPLPDWARFFSDPGEAARSDLLVELRLGRTGPRALGGAVQTSWHGLYRAVSGSSTPVDPVGWDLYQTSNAASVDVSIEYSTDFVQLSRRTPGFTRFTGSRPFAQLSPRTVLNVGGVVDGASIGMEARAGVATADSSRAVGPLARPAAKVPFEAYAWGRVDGRYVAYNRLIQGALIDGVSSEVELRHLVGDFTVGATLRLFGLEVAYAQIWRTAEFTPVPAGARHTHNFGSLQISFVY